MPRILKNIRIDEVSACTKGAGVGTKIVLMKRDTSGDDFDEWHREQAAIAERQNEEHVRKHDEHEERVRTAARERFLENLRNPSETAKSFVAAARRDNADRHDEEVSVEDTIAEKDDGGGNDHHASRVADLLVESGTATDRKQALAWLLHHKDG
ncbi:MAG TPA: hypothetical protein VKE42_09185, partial [Candidatus Cybelea sp.]|nr:hypothetical protein [Candidatus Cybelea sp.]